MNKILLILGISLFLLSCGTQVSQKSNEENSDYKEMVSHKWVLTDNNETLKNYSGEDITLNFNVESGDKISGFASCNSYFAPNYQVDDYGTLIVGNITATKKYCPDMKIERNYFDLLGHVNKYKMVNGSLNLYKDELLLLTFDALIE